MRSLLFFLIILFYGLSTEAQPMKSFLSGPILMEESADTMHVYQTKLSFLPDQFSTEYTSNSMFEATRTKPGIAMLSSAIIPGSGQALNDKWGRATIYLLAEVISLAYYFNQNGKAKDNERAYEAYADQNWSPVAYAKWLVDYSNAHGLNQDLNEFLNLSELVSNLEPDFEKTSNDWGKLGTSGLSLIRKVEVKTPFIKQDGTIRSEFSHVLQDFGSQQYYELMSKYYQFQPGWQDFYTTRNDLNGLYYGYGENHISFGYTWDNSMITPNFMEGRDRAAEFNENYRQAGNIIKFLVVNHVISAFDAFFTIKLKNTKLETKSKLVGEESISLIWHF